MVTSGERDGHPRIYKLVGAVTPVAALEFGERAAADFHGELRITDERAHERDCRRGVRDEEQAVAALGGDARGERGAEGAQERVHAHVQLVDGLALARWVEERAPRLVDLGEERVQRARGPRARVQACARLDGGVPLGDACEGSFSHARAEKLAGAPCST